MNIDFQPASISIDKQFSHRWFGKSVQRENLHECRQTCSNAELFAGSRHCEIDTDGGPKLEADRVVAVAVKGLDAQAVFEPAEEQLDLPALAVGFRDNRSRHVPEVGPKGETAGVFDVVDGDAPQVTGPMIGNVGAVESDDLVGAKRTRAVDGAGRSHIGSTGR